jgi:hypothetical protein
MGQVRIISIGVSEREENTYAVLPYAETHIQASGHFLEKKMSLKQLTIAVLVSVCTFVAHATAQKNELSGLVGRTFISDQAITGSTFSDNKLRFGNGLSFEVNYARRVLNLEFFSVSLEVPFVLNPDEDLHTFANPASASYRSYFVTPAARLNVFPDLAVSPWVSVGGGFGHFSDSSASTPSTKGTTTGVFQAGLGLDVKLFHKFSLRGEARDFWSGVPQLNVNTSNSRQHNLLVSGGIVWHF